MTETSPIGDPSVSSMPDARANVCPGTIRFPSDALTLDELLAEPIVQQLMHSDHTDEATVRQVWQHMAAARSAEKPTCTPQLLQGRGAETAAWEMHEIAELWHKRCAEAVRAQLPRMTWTQCAVLIHLAHSGNITQAALAHHLRIAPTALVHLLDRLGADGLVTRLPDSHDHRARLLELTSKALPVIARIYELTRGIERDAKLGLSGCGVALLHALLRRLRSTPKTDECQVPTADAMPGSRHA